MGSLNRLFAAVSAVSFLAASSIVYHHYYVKREATTATWLLIKGLALVLSLVISACSYDLARSCISRRYTLGSLLQAYAFWAFIRLTGPSVRRRMERESERFSEVQAQLLDRFLRANQDTVYGREHELSQIHSREEFRRQHPLSTYERYRGYVDRMVAGETGVLTNLPLTQVAVSSGTTGRAKLLPMVGKPSIRSAAALYAFILPLYLFFQKFPAVKLRKFMRLTCRPNKMQFSQSGAFIGSLSAAPNVIKAGMFLYSEPDPVTDICDEQQARYLHLLFALSDRDLGSLTANFASLIFHAMQVLQEEWPQLATDIETGTINADLDIDVDIRNRLEKELTADPFRAEEIRRECGRGFDGIVLRLWPCMQALFCISSGSQDVYHRSLLQTTCRDVAFFSPFYVASEGILAVNITAQAHDYVLTASSVFFEFIRVEDSHLDQPPTLFGEQVDVGQEYEVAVTLQNGFCRYRYGDVVRVVGFHKQTPVIQFSYRIGQILNVHMEKTSEETFYQALREAAARWRNHSLIDYSTAESVLLDTLSDDPIDATPHYVVFVELEGNDEVSLSDEEKNYIDEALRVDSFVYDSFREKGSIGAMQVHVVRRGSFTDLKYHVISNTSTANVQYKVPRVLRNTEHLRLLMERIVR